MTNLNNLYEEVLLEYKEDVVDWGVEKEEDEPVIKDKKPIPKKRSSSTFNKPERRPKPEKAKLRWVKRKSAGASTLELSVEHSVFTTPETSKKNLGATMQYRQFMDENPNIQVLILFRREEPIARAIIWDNCEVDGQKTTVLDSLHPQMGGKGMQKYFKRFADRKGWHYVEKGTTESIRFIGMDVNDIVKFNGDNITRWLETFKVLNGKDRSLQSEGYKTSWLDNFKRRKK